MYAAAFIGTLIGCVVGIAIGNLFAAIFLKWAYRIVVKDSLMYGEAYRTSLIAIGIACVGGFLVGLCYGEARFDPETAPLGVEILLYLFSLLAGSIVVKLRHDLTIGQSALVILLQGVLIFAVSAVIFVLLFAIVGVDSLMGAEELSIVPSSLPLFVA